MPFNSIPVSKIFTKGLWNPIWTFSDFDFAAGDRQFIVENPAFSSFSSLLKYRGESTFMVEMLETSNILNNAGPKSLVILDEIGRGTSTFDGVSIAWAVCEFLNKKSGARPKTMFATHFHELGELERSLEGIKNYNITAREAGDEIVFMRKIVPGVADKSYGIQVGRLAGGLLLTSYGLLMYSRVASAETENLAAIMLAVTWYWARRERPGQLPIQRASRRTSSSSTATRSPARRPDDQHLTASSVRPPSPWPTAPWPLPPSWPEPLRSSCDVSASPVQRLGW